MSSANYPVQPVLDLQTIEAQLVAWAEKVTGLRAVWQSDNAPQPSEPFVALDWLSISPLNDGGFEEEYNATTEQSAQSYYNSYSARLDVQVHAGVLIHQSRIQPNKHALSVCLAMIASIDFDDVRATYFTPFDFAIVDTTSPSRLPLMRDTIFTSRAGYEATLNLAGNAGEVGFVPAILSIALTGIFSDSADGDYVSSISAATT